MQPRLSNSQNGIRRIPGTNFFVSVDCISSKNVLQNFFSNMLNNSISEIVTFADEYLVYEEGSLESYDFCLKERQYDCHPYDVEVKRVSGYSVNL